MRAGSVPAWLAFSCGLVPREALDAVRAIAEFRALAEVLGRDPEPVIEQARRWSTESVTPFALAFSEAKGRALTEWTT